jgi:four helix bundle protein
VNVDVNVNVNVDVNVNVNVNIDVNGDGDGDENPQLAPTSCRWKGMLSFQKLDVYRCAVEFLAFAAAIPEGVPKGFSSLTEQLRRAALSVPLNIAEATGRSTRADAARHYAIARGSAMECAAIMDSLHALSILDDAQHAKALELVARIVAMLTRLCR